MTSFSEKTIQSERIYSGKVIQLDVETVVQNDDRQAVRELVRHPGAVAIIAITPENKLVVVEQYRKALEKSIVEIPAGKIEKGEEPAKTALRELKEETGYTAGGLTFITSFYTAPGFSDELIHIYEAADLKKGEQQLDEGEALSVSERTLEECEQLIIEEQIHDSKTVYAIQYWKLKATSAE